MAAGFARRRLRLLSAVYRFNCRQHSLPFLRLACRNICLGILSRSRANPRAGRGFKMILCYG